MKNLEGRRAVVVGASRGIGQATLGALAAQGMHVWGVARGRERLERIVHEAPGKVTARVADATDPEVAKAIVHELDPDLLVLALGVRPKLAPLDEHTWESFSAPWGTDVKAAFHLLQAAIRRPMRPGTTVVVISSGAAIGGSPLSGGYAGAKRMQWFLAGYAQRISQQRELGIRFATLVPKQLVVGTEIAEEASTAYGAESGLGQKGFMDRFGAPLVPEGVASAVLAIARDDEQARGPVVAVTGAGLELLQ